MSQPLARDSRSQAQPPFLLPAKGGPGPCDTGPCHCGRTFCAGHPWSLQWASGATLLWPPAAGYMCGLQGSSLLQASQLSPRMLCDPQGSCWPSLSTLDNLRQAQHPAWYPEGQSRGAMTGFNCPFPWLYRPLSPPQFPYLRRSPEWPQLLPGQLLCLATHLEMKGQESPRGLLLFVDPLWRWSCECGTPGSWQS